MRYLKQAKFGVVGALAMLMSVAPGVAQQANKLGEALFMDSCAACHGTDGASHGEFAEMLTVRPSDLTLIAKNNNGVFPYLDVFHIVDGRAIVRAHGSAMPIWGQTFAPESVEDSNPYGRELIVRAKITALVDYVESLQKM